jgi:hypothetical protein
MPDPELKNENVKIQQIVDHFSQGELSVPEFQRGDVWRPNKAARLLDSLYRKYPISCLVAWQTTKAIEHRDRHKAHFGMVRWILDGQQRIRTLLKIRDGDLQIMFNVDREKFSRENAATKTNSAWLRVTDVWNEDSYLELRQTKTPAQEKRLERVRRILDYEIPLITMIDHEFTDAVESFQRINTMGVRLGRAEIESAQIAERHAGFVRTDFIPFVRDLKSKGFDRLSSTHLFRACAFIARPDARTRILLHQMETHDLKAAWKKTKRATSTALELLTNELGLNNMNLLWSGSLLVPVICFCNQPVKYRKNKEIAGWIGLAALHHRYSKSSEYAVDQDLKACRTHDPISALLTNIRGKRAGLLSGEYDFTGNIADRSALFAAYVACRHLGAMDLITRGKIGSTVDRHHIFPRRLFDNRQDADVVANIAFTSGDANKAISDSHPSVYLSKIDSKVLHSQAIPSDPSLWDIDRSEDFWAKRRELLSEAFNDYVRHALPNRKKL